MKIRSLDARLIVPACVIAVFALLHSLDGYNKIENRLYDAMLHIKPQVPENQSVLLLDVDDLAIEQIGLWPWSRNIMGEGLIVMKEFGARYAVFDIEFREESPRGVNSTYLERVIPREFAQEFGSIQRHIRDLFTAIASGAIPLDEAEEFIGDLTALTDSSRTRLLGIVRQVARDNDQVLGDGARFFQNAYFTVTTYPVEEQIVGPDYERWVTENMSYEHVVDSGGTVPGVGAIGPAIPKVLRNAAGAGFPTVVVDEDGYRRRVDLFHRYGDHYFGQLAFRPLLDWLGSPTATITPRAVILENASLPSGQQKDLRIPLSQDGRFLLNWPKKTYEESFRHMTYYYVYLHDRQEEQLLANLRTMDEAGFTGYYQGASPLLTAHNRAETIKQRILSGATTAESAYQDYRESRRYFFAEVGSFLDGRAQTELLADIEAVLSSEDLTDDERRYYDDVRQDVQDFFSASGELYTGLSRTRSILRRNLDGAFCIIGWTGTSTTDRGVNPFDPEYINVGTHAALINTVVEGRFIRDLAWWWSLAVAAVLCFAVYFVIRRIGPLPSIIIGVGFVAAVFGIGVLIFVTARLYIGLLTPLAAVFCTFVVLTFIDFLVTAREKSFIRNAFGHYLSADVINQLIENPDRLTLGGEKKYMTAMFTDIKGFSSISEELDPVDLVALLNEYLTEMSDIILSLRGTIDKFEGDAIISFFGAPIEYQDHARRACLAAVQMKRAEQRLNQRFLDSGTVPSPLLTRIGINTGEMVVGNMGTSTKMDYTIMGNSVNLAARLEGVNKQYGTWVLVSEATRDEAGDDLVFRRLDRVRVVNITKPVQLYQLVEERDNIDDSTKEAVELFNEGLELFYRKEWTKAQKAFVQTARLLPEDGPSATFIKRCQEYKKNPPPPTWDGTFNLSVK